MKNIIPFADFRRLKILIAELVGMDVLDHIKVFESIKVSKKGY